MKRVFLDTNILVDILAKRAPFFEDAAELLSMADKRQIILTVSSLTIANTAYILLKHHGSANAKSILRKIRLIIEVVPLDDKIIGLALDNEDFQDLEDGLQYFTALENNQDLIITRNLKDYKKSRLPFMTANQFIKTVKES